MVLRIGLLSTTAMITLAVSAGGAFAQGVLTGPPPSEYVLDERGVDVVSGTFNLSTTDVVIGQPGQGGLVYSRAFAGSGWRDNLTGTIQAPDTSTVIVSIGGHSERFTKSGSTYTPAVPRGSSLTQAGGTYTWTWSDGTVATFSSDLGDFFNPAEANVGRITNLTYPNGETLRFHYQTVELQTPPEIGRASRLIAVTNNFGYQLKLDYQLEPEPTAVSQFAPWTKVVRVTGFNMTVDFCNPGVTNCDSYFSRTWPSATYGETSAASSVTDQSGRVTNYSYSNGRMAGIRPPGESSNVVSVGYAGSTNRVSSVTVGPDTWTYAYSGSGTQTTTITDPSSQSSSAVSNTSNHTLTSWTNPLSETTSYLYDQGRVSRITLPEGNYTSLTYDARGNVTQTTVTPKAGSGLSPITTSATYPATCANPLTCNLPLTTTDERGYVTDYTYDPDHGGLLTVTLPAPTTGAVRPQVRYTYADHHAWYRDAWGAIVQDPAPVALLTQTSQCPTTATCAGGADEVRTKLTYGASGVANNLLPTTVTQRNGAGTLLAPTNLTYTAEGNVATVDGPLPGTADTTVLRYDNARQLVGVVGPDPDGAGPLLHRATRHSYTPRGQVYLSEQGTVAGYTDPQWSAFSSLQQVAAQYDPVGRPVRTTGSADGTTYGLQQYSYANGRLDCTALRMNPASFASPPASACSLATAGAYGQDRITRTLYDVAGRPDEVIEGFGTSAASTTVQATYTANGQVQTLLDGNGNRTTYEYDGYDRLLKTRYPTASNGSVSSTTDYDLYGYDAASNRVSHRDRSGQITAATYDALNRLTLLDAPAGTTDVGYAYDNLGRLVNANVGAHTLSFAWDALGRQVSQTSSALGTYSYQYDLASRRTRITWNDGFYAQYDYDLTGAMTAVRENGATTGPGVLATYAYDNLGRRTSIVRGNGVTTTFTWDSASRLTGLSHDLASTANDVSLTFGRNPVGQITTRTVSNDVYVYDDVASGIVDYSIDGLNRVAAVESTPLTYDTRGNLTNDSVAAYVYDGFNRLTSADGTTLQYDPAGRLYREVDAANTRFGYAGDQLIAEHLNVSPSFRRHVPGPDLGAPVASYDGAGTTARSWPLTDERGSVIAVTGATGAASAINTYDEYGVPGAGNVGRFAYTGQMGLAGTGVYHYRARGYHPGLGRFLQTDPIGYGDGMSLYAYVGGDPVNRVDPWGLEATTVGPVTVIGKDCSGSYVSAKRCPHSDGGGGVVQTSNPSGGPTGFGPPRRRDEEQEEDDCEHRGPDGTCYYRRNEDDELVLDEDYARERCRAYNDFMRTNAWHSWGAAGLGLGATLWGGVGGAAFYGFAGLLTASLGLASPPPGCNEE